MDDELHQTKSQLRQYRRDYEDEKDEKEILKNKLKRLKEEFEAETQRLKDKMEN